MRLNDDTKKKEKMYPFIVGPEPSDDELKLCSATPSLEFDRDIDKVKFHEDRRTSDCMMINLYLFLMKEDIGVNIVKLVDMHSYRVVSVNDEKYGNCVLKVIKNRCRSINGRLRPPIPSEIRIMTLLRKHKIKGVPEFYKWYYHDTFSTMLMPFYLAHNIECMWDDQYKIVLFMLQLLRILKDLLDVDIMHRDVKLSNVLWNNDTQTLMLIDFGLATINARGKHVKGVGTRGYMAPEVFQNHENKDDKKDCVYNYKADIYSAGIVLGNLLYSKHESDTNREEVKSWREVSRDILRCKKATKAGLVLHDLFLNMTAKKPDDRISYKNAIRILERIINK